GPDKGGPYGPYRQSERSHVYREHVDMLLEKGHAFHCFCTEERLAQLRERQMAEKQQPGYDGHCARLPREEVAEKLRMNTPHVIRMRVPEEGNCVVKDLLREDVEIAWSQVDMQVLMKSDGM